jgi:hypothetical protein
MGKGKAIRFERWRTLGYQSSRRITVRRRFTVKPLHRRTILCARKRAWHDRSLGLLGTKTGSSYLHFSDPKTLLWLLIWN